MENVGITSLEMAISIFGPEEGAKVWTELNNSGGKATPSPYPRVIKIVDYDSDLGDWGDFVAGVEFGKDDDGNRIIVNDGENLGRAGFQFLIVSSKYNYKQWDDVKERSYYSNTFDTLSGCATAIDFKGRSLGNKQEKKAANWKLWRTVYGLIRKDEKAGWQQAAFSISGAMLFGFNSVLDGKLHDGKLAGIVDLKFGKAKKGSTTFVTICLENDKGCKEASSFLPLPNDIFQNKDPKNCP